MGVCRAGCAGCGWVWRVCRGCVWVCRGCVGWVCYGSVGGACRPGVSRARAGCVRGVSAGCARGRMEAVCPGARDSPPLPSAPVPSRLRVSSTRVCAPGCGFLFFPGDFLFSASALRVPRESRRRPLETHARLLFAVPSGLVPLFPGDSKRRKTHARLLSAVRRARRFYSPSPSSATAVPTAPQRRTLPTFPNFTPPAKNTPPPLGDPAHSPEWMSGVHLGVCALGRRPPRVLLACRASSFVFSAAFQTARRQGGASKRRARRCL